MLGLPKELWELISTDNPTTYYKLLQVAKVFKLNTDIMKAKFIKVTEVNDAIYYRLPNAWLHSCNDQPAEIRTNGDQLWYIDNMIHRDNDLPAVICTNGCRYWCIDGKIHRDGDQPAEIWSNDSKFWWKNGDIVASQYTITSRLGVNYETKLYQ